MGLKSKLSGVGKNIYFWAITYLCCLVLVTFIIFLKRVGASSINEITNISLADAGLVFVTLVTPAYFLIGILGYLNLERFGVYVGGIVMLIVTLCYLILPTRTVDFIIEKKEQFYIIIFIVYFIKVFEKAFKQIQIAGGGKR